MQNVPCLTSSLGQAVFRGADRLDRIRTHEDCFETPRRGSLGKIADIEEVFKRELKSLQASNKDYWSFRGNAARQHGHAYFQYPAMMVPQMQGDLISAATKASPSIRRVFDPFVGSGTALTESIMNGLDFSGFDINPLAILLCRAKTIPFFDQSIEQRFNEVMDRVRSDRGCRLETTFKGWNKWFRRDAAIALSRIRRSIAFDDGKWARQFFWVALAETVRVSSNSRTSTFKLHIRPEDDRLNRAISPIATFEKIATRNLKHLRAAKEVMAERQLISRGRYLGDVTVDLCDAAKATRSRSDDLCDLLVTSPPYGDNATTIPYGQHSFLPLQWIELSDIDCDVDETCLRSTHEIDSRSLGGSRAVSEKDRKELRAMSRTFAECLRDLKDEPSDRQKRVTAFSRDLNRCINPILSHLRKGAFMVWIVGNRRVAGRSFPLDRILSELLVSRGAKRIARIKRIIPSKRMAVRNDTAETMGRETILVLRKG